MFHGGEVIPEYADAAYSVRSENHQAATKDDVLSALRFICGGHSAR